MNHRLAAAVCAAAIAVLPAAPVQASPEHAAPFASQHLVCSRLTSCITYYYSNGSYTTVVGALGTACGGSSVHWGQVTAWSKLTVSLCQPPR